MVSDAPIETDAEARRSPPPVDWTGVRRIHVMGICGSAMGAFAGMLRLEIVVRHLPTFFIVVGVGSSFLPKIPQFAMKICVLHGNLIFCSSRQSLSIQFEPIDTAVGCNKYFHFFLTSVGLWSYLLLPIKFVIT